MGLDDAATLPDSNRRHGEVHPVLLPSSSSSSRHDTSENGQEVTLSAASDPRVGDTLENVHAETSLKTPVPSEARQALTLIKRNFHRDRAMPFVWAARTFLGPIMVLLYTIGFYINYEESAPVTRVGDYVLHEARNWSLPKTLYAASSHAELLDAVSEHLNTVHAQRMSVVTQPEYINNRTAFADFCEDAIGNQVNANRLCVYLEVFGPIETFDNGGTSVPLTQLSPSNLYTNMTIYYSGEGSLAPYEAEITGVQHFVHSAMWVVTASNKNASGNNAEAPSMPYTVDQIQSVPTRFRKGKINDSVRYFGMAIGSLIAFAMALSSGYLLSPIVTEQVQEIHLTFTRAGIRPRTYVFQWLLYYSLNGILTAAALTAITFVWKLYPMSGILFVFISHYLAMVHAYSCLVLFSQLATQEEMALNMPFIVFLFSVVVIIPLVVVDAPQQLMTAVSILSPYIGIISYTGIYYRYDTYGYDTGITNMSDAVDAGLIGTYCAQLSGIILYCSIIFVAATPRLRSAILSMLGRSKRTSAAASESGTLDPIREENFEQLAGRDDVQLMVRNLIHTYPRSLFSKKRPSNVLHGLDLDVCRGSILGLLGHNGSGKSTAIRILSGEQEIQGGSVVYHLKDGAVQLQPGKDVDCIRGKIGVCPQHNSLLGTMTCRQNLRLLAEIRGGIAMESGQTVEEAIDAEVDRLIRQIKFTSAEDADKPVNTYSGGMKRKVCIAIALLGDPDIVLLDEPTAGIDPYNRRMIWDMIIAAKSGRSIILCSHHLEEVDLLSDRVAILKNGRIISAGTTLFLKHHFGAGYSLRFDSAKDLDVTCIISSAKKDRSDRPGNYCWELSHGTEPQFSHLLKWLELHKATNIEVQLTTLEQVFLATGKEDHDDEDFSTSDGSRTNCHEGDEAIHFNSRDESRSFLARVWDRAAEKQQVSFWQKFFLVSKFVMQDSWKQPEAVMTNVTFPFLYMVGGMIAVRLVGEADEVERIVSDPVPIETDLLGGIDTEFFGLNTTETSVEGVAMTETPSTLEDYFSGSAMLGGYWPENRTLQYGAEVSGFANQIGAYFLALGNYGRLSTNVTEGSGLGVHVQQLPYDSEPEFRVDFIVLPIALVYGFTGMVMTMIDILTLKANNIISLFRVAGINEWTVYLGVTFYKAVLTFVPFFVVALTLGFSLKLVLFGNAGRWLATITIFIVYAYSAAPMGMLISKRFITNNFNDAKSWFPSVYFTVVSLPYVAWNMAYQLATDAQDILLVAGDILLLVPPVAFQRALGAVIDVSLRFDDSELEFGDVWKLQTRVLLAIILMLVVGTAEWIYLHRLTSAKPQVTTITEGEESISYLEGIQDPDVLAEMEQSQMDDAVIKVREVVKVFRVQLGKDIGGGQTVKRAVKGVSFGVGPNEIFVLLGPNGAGKTTLMSVLAGSYSPEHGSVMLNKREISNAGRSIDHVFNNNSISWCPQHDSLFPGLTVSQHLQFYTRIRGLCWEKPSVQDHVDAIVQLLGLRKHVDKRPTELSGGYKRRLSLAVAMIGYPTAMLVDECTTGLDPGARHLVWEALKPDLIGHEYDLPAVLFSTHYMDEAEVLATRIGIMIDGKFVAAGSLDQLQDRYCKSYFVEVALDQNADSESTDNIIKAIETQGMEATIYESLPYNIKLQIPFQTFDNHEQTKHVQQLAKLFELMESHKEDNHVKFYSIAQMSLEQIFIDLSKKQFNVHESTSGRPSA